MAKRKTNSGIIETWKQSVTWTAIIGGAVLLYFLLKGRSDKAESALSRTIKDPLSYF